MLAECQLFGTLGCLLCEDAEAVLMPLVLERGLLVELVDISNSAVAIQRYELRIPVLKRVDTGRELDWPFDTDQALDFLC